MRFIKPFALPLLPLLFVLASCASPKEKAPVEQAAPNPRAQETPAEAPTAEKGSPEAPQEIPAAEKDSSEIPADGSYRFAIAFAEWGGKSMGEQVTVLIKGNRVKVIYEGDGDLTAEAGTVLDEGILLKHKSGQWIIATDESDADLDEVGGCTDGPSVIDFAEKKYWMC